MSLKTAQAKVAAIDKARATTPIVKPAAAAASGTTDTGTGATTPAAPTPVPYTPAPAPNNIPFIGKLEKPKTPTLVESAVDNAKTATINAPIQKPQASIQQGTTDTATGGTLPIKPSTDPNANATDSGSPSFLTPDQSSGTISGGGSIGGGGSSVGGSAPATVTPITPATPTTPAPTGETKTTTPTTPTPPKEQNVYFDKLLETKFDYDPNSDKSLQQARANAENAIIQSIIGRGGIYSSVARSAVATKMIDLGIEYEEAAYKKYVDERTYMFSLAQFEQGRIDTAWEQNFKVESFEAEQQQIQFQNQLNLAEFQFAQEKEAFDQRMTVAAAQAASARSYASSGASSAKAQTEAEKQTLALQLEQNRREQATFTTMRDQWINNGGEATRAVANYFASYGVTVGSSITDFEDTVTGIETRIANDAVYISGQAQTLEELEMSNDYLEDQINLTTPKATGTDASNSTTAQRTAYQNYYNQATSGTQTKSGLEAQIRAYTSSTGSVMLRQQLGDYYYGELIDSLLSAKNSAD